jgi:hypothetical protein
MLKSPGRILSGINYKYVKPWFFSSDDPEKIKAPYVISFVFLLLTVWAIIIQLSMKSWQFYEIFKMWRKSGGDALPQIESLARVEMSLVPLITVLIGTSGMFIGLYNWGKKGKDVITFAVTNETESTGQPSGDGKIRDNEV